MALALGYHHYWTDVCFLYFRGLQLTSPPWRNMRVSVRHTKSAGSAVDTGFMYRLKDDT